MILVMFGMTMQITQKEQHIPVFLSLLQISGMLFRRFHDQISAFVRFMELSKNIRAIFSK